MFLNQFYVIFELEIPQKSSWMIYQTGQEVVSHNLRVLSHVAVVEQAVKHTIMLPVILDTMAHEISL